MNTFWDDFEDTNKRDNKMKFTVTPAFTRETEQQPRGTAINPEKYRRCMRLRIESIKLFLVNLGFIFFSNFMFSHQIWKKKLNLIGFNLWLKQPQNLNPFSSLFLYFAVDIHREKFNQGKNSHYVLLLRFSTIWKKMYIYIFKRMFQWWAKRAQQISNHLCGSAFLKNKK